MSSKTFYTVDQYRRMRRELIRCIEDSDLALIQVLLIVTRVRRAAVDGTIHSKVSEIIEMCDEALAQSERTPCEIPKEE